MECTRHSGSTYLNAVRKSVARSSFEEVTLKVEEAA